MLRVCALSVASLAALAWPSAAAACKCAPPPSVKDATQSAAAVFEGRVLKTSALGATDRVVELEVVRTFKAANVEHVLVHTRADEAACGFPFVVGESYLVYAQPAAPTTELPGLEVSRCGRTQPISAADHDLTELGMGVVPVSPNKNDLPPGVMPNSQASERAAALTRDKPAAGGCATCSVAIGRRRTLPPLAASGLGLCAIALRARRRRQRRSRFQDLS